MHNTYTNIIKSSYNFLPEEFQLINIALLDESIFE